VKPYTGLKLFLGFGLVTAVLGGAGTAHAQQRWDDRCANQIAKDQDEVDRAVNRYGYDSRQAQHERDELQSDAQKCGYSRNSTYYDDRYRDDRWGDRNDRGNYNNGRSAYSNPAYDIGYRDGIAIGQKDSQRRKSFRPQKNDQYEDADNGYDRRYGDKNQYKNLYREGFQRGYAEGYRQWR
jgi:hypothetical protein